MREEYTLPLAMTLVFSILAIGFAYPVLFDLISTQPSINWFKFTSLGTGLVAMGSSMVLYIRILEHNEVNKEDT